jgi:peptidoglycan hydrolase-like protein with peptidoglycan-binding domain
MNVRILMLVSAPLITAGVFAADEPVSPPTEQTSPEPSADINRRVQEKLRERGFYAGPINGDIGPNTQAALAQFQLSIPLPASGQMDDQTLAALGIERAKTGAEGATQESSVDASAAISVKSGSSGPAETK